MMQEIDSSKVFTTSEVCELFRISKSTLFRWEREGLIPPAERDRSRANQRLYGERDLAAIRTKHLRSLFRSASRAEDIDALTRAQETLSLQKIKGGDFLGIDELVASRRVLSAEAMKQLLRTAADKLDTADELFKEVVERVLKSCREMPRPTSN